MDIMEQALNCASPGNPVLFIGPPGIGKSARIEAWAQDQDMQFIVEHPVIAQSVDYRGLPAVVEGEAHWLPLGNLKAICELNGPATVVLLDDVGQASQSVQAALMQLVWARKLGDAHVRDNVTFIMASNRCEDRAGVRPILSALVGRCQIVSLTSDTEVWGAWALKQDDLDSRVVGYVKFRPDCFVDKVPDQPMQPFCTPRSLTSMGYLTAKGITSLDLLAGWVGMPVASDFKAYCDSVSKIPSIEAILDNPLIVQNIVDPGLLHAIIVQAARRGSEQPDEVIKLASEMKGGWGVQLVSSTVDYAPEIKKTNAFKHWAVMNKNVL